MVEKVKAKKVREGGDEIRKLIYRTLAPTPEIARKTTNAFRSMLLIAPMQRGKTSWAEAMLGETIAYLISKEGIDEEQIGYVYAEAVPVDRVVEVVSQHMDLKKLVYLFIFSDDAAAAPGQHGRQASHKANVEVSKFYIRIRHILRKRYGYERALTAIHATQVYHLIDKTFREGSDIDVLKALPKSQTDRKQIASLIHPEYVYGAFEFLRALGRKRVLARTMREFLEAIYTAVVIVDGYPFIVRAYKDPSNIDVEVERRKAWLRMVQHVRMDEETIVSDAGVEIDATSNPATPCGNIGDVQYALEAAHHVITRLLDHAKLVSRGANWEIRFPKDTKLYIRKEILERIHGALAEQEH